MKSSAIQRDNVNREHAASIITTNVQNVVRLCRHKSGHVISIRQSPHRQLSAVFQTRLHSDAAAVVLSNV